MSEAKNLARQSASYSKSARDGNSHRSLKERTLTTHYTAKQATPIIGTNLDNMPVHNAAQQSEFLLTNRTPTKTFQSDTGSSRRLLGQRANGAVTILRSWGQVAAALFSGCCHGFLSAAALFQIAPQFVARLR